MRGRKYYDGFLYLAAASPDMRQAPKCAGVKPVNGITTPPLDNW